MNIRTLVISISLSVVISIAFTLGYSHYNNNKIGYIKSAIILKDYKAMIAATDQFNEELKVVQANLDTLRIRYETLKAGENNITSKEKGDWAYHLGKAQTEYEKYNEQASQQMQGRRNELTNKVLESINSFIQTYGKEHHYQLILGTTEDGSILYGEEGDDLTADVLNELNHIYDESGEKKK